VNPKLIEQMGNAMGDVYAAVVNEILVNMAKHFPYIDDSDTAFSVWQYQTTKLGELGQIRRETLDILVNMLGGADAVLRSYLQNAILDGVRDADKPIQDAAKAGLLPSGWRIPPEVSPEQTQAFKAFYRQSADKLNLVNTVMLESTQQAYQSTVSDIVSRMQRTQTILNTQTGKVVTGVTALNQAMRDGVKQMVQNGITGFIDHAGRRWTPEAYVTMDIRTTLANTARAAVFERSEETGNDLYQVSYHDGARPLCYPWQGKVISRQDLSREVTDRDGNTVHVYAQSETTYGEAAGLFGINCGHYPIPFVPGFSKIRPPEQDAEENAKEYEQSQRQRALERNLRNEKRDLAVLKAQGATDDEIKAQRERVRAASAKLDDFCDSTGRARRRSREYTPTNPTFPDKDTYDPGTFRKTQRDKMREFFRSNGLTSGPSGGSTPAPAVNVAQQATQKPVNAVQSTFVPVKTKAEAEQYAHRFAKQVNYGTVSIKSCNEINRTLTEIYERFPSLKPLEEIQQKSMGAIASANFRTLNINARKIGRDSTKEYLEQREGLKYAIETIKSRYKGTIPKDMQKQIDGYERRLKFKRWSISGQHGVRGTIAHEFGHVLIDQYLGQINPAHVQTLADSGTCSRLLKLVKDTYKEAHNNGDIFDISEYGSTNDHEFFAECFCALFNGDKLPDYIESMVKEVTNVGQVR